MAKAKPSQTAVRLGGRVWIEINDELTISEDGADLMEQIDALGSLTKAARNLGFSYRHAWSMIDTMNRRWPAPLVTMTTGGKHGGGAQLTDHGRAALGAYRDLQLRLAHLLDHASVGFTQSLGLDATQ